MPNPIVYEFAEIDSEEEIVVHLGNVADEMSVYDLAVLLQMPAIQIVKALGLPSNDAAGREVYTRLRDQLDGTLSPGGAVRLVEPLALPLESDLEYGEVDDWLLLIYTHFGGAQSTWSWHLPGQDLYLPSSPDLLAQLEKVYASGPRPDTIFALGTVAADGSALETAEFFVEKLELALDNKFAKLDQLDSDEHLTSTLAGIQMAKTVVEFQHKHWWSERVKGRISADEEATRRAELKSLDDSLAALEVAAWGDFEEQYLKIELEWADKLLDILDPAKGNRELHALIALAFTDRSSIGPEVRNKTVDVTLRACRALARSGRTERFVREHVIDMLEEAGSKLSPAAKEVLHSEGRELGAAALGQWDEAISRLRAGAGVDAEQELGASPLRAVQRGIREYRLGLSGVSSLLEQGVVAQVFVYLRQGAKPGATEFRRLAWHFGALLLRGLAADAVQHRGVTNELVASGVPRLRLMVRTLAAIDEDTSKEFIALAGGSSAQSGRPSRAFWMRQGGRLKDLQVRPIPRSPAGAAARIGVSFLAFVLATQALRIDDPAAWCTLTSASLNLGEHSLRAAEWVVKGAPAGGTLKEFDILVKRLSGVASLFAGVSSILRIRGMLERDRHTEAALETLSGASSLGVAFGQLMMSGWYGESLLAAGAVLNAWAVAVGIAAFAARMIYESVTGGGTQPVLRALLSRLSNLPQCARFRPAIQDAAERVDSLSRALVPLRRIPGHGAGPARGGSPTYWQAAKAGFSKAMIEEMFDAPHREVAIHLSPFFDRSPGSSGSEGIEMLGEIGELEEPEEPIRESSFTLGEP